MNAKTAGFIGGGRVAHIILGGFKQSGTMPEYVVVSDTNPEVLAKLQQKYPEIHLALNDNQQAASQDLVFVGLHPPVLGSFLGEIEHCLKPGALLISLAPKLTFAKLSAGLGGFQRIARLIPNAPSIIGEGYNPIAFAPGLPAAEKAQLLVLLQGLGTCPEVAEEKLEAYAIMTAMGPTYLWFQFHELSAIAQSFGLTQAEVEAGIAAMVTGAVKTMFESGLSPVEVMDLVPVKPMGEEEANIKAAYHTRLEGLYQKLKTL